MNSTLKILIPLGLLIAVVFAITFFSQYTPNDDPGSQGDSKIQTRGERPLVFFSTSRRWDPRHVGDDGILPPPLADRIFPGVYEVGETQHSTAFWFENRNPAPVSLQLNQVTCSACSGGRLAPIPPESMRHLFQMNAIGLLPMGPVSGCPVGMGGASANLVESLEWQSHEFKDPSQVVYNVPAAANTDGWSPQWGILDLNFKVRPGAVAERPLGSEFIGQIQGSDQRDTYRFQIHFDAAAAFELDRMQIDVGTLTDSSSEQTHELIVFSSTRPLDEFQELNVGAHVRLPGGGEPGPFVAAGQPVPLTEKEREQLSEKLAAEMKRPVRILSALRFPILVRARVGMERVDIGRIEREIWVSASLPGSDPRRVVLSGNVTGPVTLAEGADINLGSFSFERGSSSRAFDVVTEQPGMELEVVADLCRPTSLKVSLEKQADRQGRGHYKLRVDVPPRQQQGEIINGVVVLQIKGKNPQKVRFPVKGRGTIR